MELASTPSAAQGVALICAPAQDTDQANDFFFPQGSVSDQQYPFNAWCKVFIHWKNSMR